MACEFPGRPRRRWISSTNCVQFPRRRSRRLTSHADVEFSLRCRRHMILYPVFRRNHWKNAVLFLHSLQRSTNYINCNSSTCSYYSSRKQCDASTNQRNNFGVSCKRFSNRRRHGLYRSGVATLHCELLYPYSDCCRRKTVSVRVTTVLGLCTLQNYPLECWKNNGIA